jgi:hypothetical protein
VTAHRSVRIEAMIERPPAPPRIGGDLPIPDREDHWPGTMLDWRWADKQAGTWSALVQYRHEGLTYLY